MILGGLAFSLFDLSYPSIGGDYERAQGEEAMTRLYAGFDGANALGALGAGLALWAGVGYRGIYVTLGVLLLILAGASLRLPLPPRDGSGAGGPTGEQAGGRLLTVGVVLAVLFVGLVSPRRRPGGLLEHLPAPNAGGRPAPGGGGDRRLLAGHAGRAAGQLGGHPRLGERRTMVAAGLGTALGTLVLVATHFPLVAAAGLLALRALEAPISPVAYSLASRSAPGRAGEAASLGWGSFYAAFLAGPLLVGALADAVGLRAALSLFVLTSLAIAGLAAWRLTPELTER